MAHLARVGRFVGMLVAVTFLLDVVVGGGLGMLFSSSRAGESAGLTNQILEEAVGARIQVYGSSRAYRHFDTDAITRVTGSEAYNLGMAGQDLTYARAMQRLLLTRGAQAQCVVVNVDVRELFHPQPERVSTLRVYAGQDAEVDRILSRHVRWFWLKRHVQLWRFNSRALSLVTNHGRTAQRGSGFQPLLGERRVLRQVDEPAGGVGAGVDIVPDAQALEYLSDMVAEAKRTGAGVLLVTAPRQGGSDDPVSAEDRSRLRRAMERFSREHGVRYVDLHEQEYVQLSAPSLWADPGHMNAAGATLLTELLLEHLRELCPTAAAADGLP